MTTVENKANIKEATRTLADRLKAELTVDAATGVGTFAPDTFSKNLPEGLPDIIGNPLPVTESKINSTGHRCQVFFAFAGVDRYGSQPCVRYINFIFYSCLLHFGRKISANLVSEPPAAGMDQD